jgi:hypothetical protein
MDREPVLSDLPGEIDLTAGLDLADPMVPIAANPDDAILRRIVERAAFSHESPEICAVSSPRLERELLSAAARELLRQAELAVRATRPARHQETSAP